MLISIAGKVFSIWLVILVAAIGNGFLREAVLIPVFGPVLGLSLSGLLLSLKGIRGQTLQFTFAEACARSCLSPL